VKIAWLEPLFVLVEEEPLLFASQEQVVLVEKPLSDLSYWCCFEYYCYYCCSEQTVAHCSYFLCFVFAWACFGFVEFGWLGGFDFVLEVERQVVVFSSVGLQLVLAEIEEELAEFASGEELKLFAAKEGCFVVGELCSYCSGLKTTRN